MADKALEADWARQIVAKTGKTLEAWVEIAKASGETRHMALVNRLKTDHGLTHGYANSVALTALGTGSHVIADDELMAAMFAGPKAAMRPIHDRIIAAAQAFGPDVELAPKKGYVSVRRKKQFAIAQPSTKDRYDLGLNLKGTPPAGRLEASGSFNAMVSHRVRIASEAEVDDEVLAWLKAAYDAAG